MRKLNHFSDRTLQVLKNVLVVENSRHWANAQQSKTSTVCQALTGKYSAWAKRVFPEVWLMLPVTDKLPPQLGVQNKGLSYP